MTPKQEAALRQALDCVSTLANARDWVGCTPNERWDEDEMYAELCNATICLKKSLSIIQEALAEQPAQQQEPVVWMYQNKSTHEVSFQKHMRSFVDHGAWYEVPLYSEPLANQEKTSGSPKPAKPEALRLAELFEVAANAAPEGDEGWLKTAAELRRMHDLLGKANALCRIRAEEIERLKAQPAQEPVAWIYEDELPECYPYDDMYGLSRIIEGVRMFPVNVAPPASKPWVGLTDREKAVIRFALHRFMADAYAQMTAAAQDKDNRYFKPGAVDAFAKDAKDAESLLAKLREKNAPQQSKEDA